MDLEDVKVGTIYKCKLSKKEMLVLELDKPTGTKPTGKNNEDGSAIMEETSVKVKAGKYVDMQGDIPTFKVDELADGQLEELTD